jgi:hypothetical protein
MMKEEALAKDMNLSKAFEPDKDPETVMRAAAGGKGSGVSNKPYRYIENYSLKSVKVWICVIGKRGIGWCHIEKLGQARRNAKTDKPCLVRAHICMAVFWCVCVSMSYSFVS